MRFTWDPRLVELEAELDALAHVLSFIEPQIDRIQSEVEVKAYSDLQEAGWSDDPGLRQLATEELIEKRDFVTPRFMRGPFIVALWACFEAGVSDIASLLKAQKGVALALNEIRNRNVLSQATRYFEVVLEVPLDLNEERLVRIGDLRVIRNAIAHANGQRRAMSAEKWIEAEKALVRQGSPPDEYRGLIVPTAEYVQRAYNDINSSLRDLIVRARAVRKPSA